MIKVVALDSAVVVVNKVRLKFDPVVAGSDGPSLEASRRALNTSTTAPTLVLGRRVRLARAAPRFSLVLRRHEGSRRRIGARGPCAGGTERRNCVRVCESPCGT